MSTGMVAIEVLPRIAMSNAMTTNVYGRRSASLTIHICQPRDFASGPSRFIVYPGRVHTLACLGTVCTPGLRAGRVVPGEPGTREPGRARAGRWGETAQHDCRARLQDWSRSERRGPSTEEQMKDAAAPHPHLNDGSHTPGSPVPQRSS